MNVGLVQWGFGVGIMVGAVFGGVALADSATGATQAGLPPDVKKHLDSLLGTWSIEERYEPSGWMPNGGTGKGEEVWRLGPGGRSCIEEYRSKTTVGDVSGLSVTWWDEKRHGLRGIWCSSATPGGCDGLDGDVVNKWVDGQWVLDNKFTRDGKGFVWHEVYRDISATSFTQYADQGPEGGELKRIVTIHATKTSK